MDDFTELLISARSADIFRRACSFACDTGKQPLGFCQLTPEHEKLIGDKLDTELAETGKIYHDAKAMTRIQKIVNKLSMQMPEKQTLKIFLCKDDSINAFCLPNGSIYVHSGLLSKVTDDNVLAFVLAHELAHIAARHGNESASKHIFLMAGDVLAENKAKKLTQSGKAGKGLLLRASYIGGGIVGADLPFRRKMENEADSLGIRYMARAGYDPHAAVRFWEELGNLNAQDPIWVKFLSTHPIDKKRHERMLKECENLKKKNSGKTSKWFRKAVDYGLKRSQQDDNSSHRKQAEQK